MTTRVSKLCVTFGGSDFFICPKRSGLEMESFEHRHEIIFDCKVDAQDYCFCFRSEEKQENNIVNNLGSTASNSSREELP